MSGKCESTINIWPYGQSEREKTALWSTRWMISAVGKEKLELMIGRNTLREKRK